MEANRNTDIIDLTKIYRIIKDSRRSLAITACITFVLSCIWIFPEPRWYKTTVTLAPETSSKSSAALETIASSFGVNMSNMRTRDAIYPLLYPGIMNSTSFAISLFDVPVKTLDGEVETDYYTYLLNHQKKSIIKMPLVWLGQGLRNLRALIGSKEEEVEGGDKSGHDLFFYSKKEDIAIEKIQSRISCSVDKKTDVITISVSDQDRLIAANIADTVRVRLQEYITDYRTNKARNDIEFYEQLTADAKTAYEEALAEYSRYADSNFNMLLESAQSRKTALANDLQMKQSLYNAASTQYQASLARLQENTPAFTTIQPAVVAQNPFKPRRSMFVLGMTFFITLLSAMWKIKDVLIGKDE